MINSETSEYYHSAYVSKYTPPLIKNTKLIKEQDFKLNIAFSLFLIFLIIPLALLFKPIVANAKDSDISKLEENNIYLEENFRQNIKNKFQKAYINYPSKGIAHIKKKIYIKGKPININIVQLNTNVNKNLKIKPDIAGNKLNSKRRIRNIAQKNNAVVAINGGYFKPQTGVPLGVLVIDGNILTGPIYNRVSIGIFEQSDKTYFKMDKVNFDIKATTRNSSIKIDNINQPRMLSTYSLIYTSVWGDYSPIAPKNCINLLIEKNKILSTSQNQIPIKNNQIVLQAPKNVVNKLIKNTDEIYIDVNLPNEFKNSKHIIGAGPYLVKDSEIYVDVTEQKFQSITGRNPRSAVGFNSNGDFFIVTVDGREKDSVGMTLFELARLMKNLGCEYAMNFDGGSSSAIYVNGKIANHAINSEGIPVSNALIVKELSDEDVELSSI